VLVQAFFTAAQIPNTDNLLFAILAQRDVGRELLQQQQQQRFDSQMIIVFRRANCL
jgi:hypothetical protein